MAKQIGVYQYRGKLGNTVGAKRSASQKANIVRAKAAAVANPKTVAQRSQRLKLTPAVNFYRAMAGILDHSFQGVTYGGPSHNFFMKKALAMGSGYPYVPKGYMQPAPGFYMISKGSLPSVTQLFNITTGQNRIDWSWTESMGENPTVATQSQLFINNLVGVEDGDQLTFIACVTNGEALDDAQFVYYTSRFIVDITSTATIAQWNASQKWTITDDGIAPTVPNLGSDYFICAFAVIVSRPPRQNGGAWQRSTEIMSVATDAQLIIFDAEAAQNALDSYAATESTATSDWYLNQGNSGSTGGATAGRSLVMAEFRGNQALFMVTNGVSRLVVSNLETVQGAQGRYVYVQNGNTADSYRKGDFIPNANLPASYVLQSTVANYFPTVEWYQQTGGSSGSVEEQP